MRIAISAVLLLFVSACARRESPPAWPLPRAFFPIMSWETPRRSADLFSGRGSGLDSLADCGYTVAGFVRPQHLKTCEKLGLKAIVAPAETPVNWREMNDQQIEAHVRQLIKDGGESKAVIGYFIHDEPGVQLFPQLAKAVAAVKKFAPGKLAYINLYPDYATIGAPNTSQLGTSDYHEYLERFVNEVKPQLISYDNYRVLMSNDLRDANVAASYFNNLLDVRRVAMEHNLPFWNIAESNQIRPPTPVPSPANLMFHAYTTLAAGGAGMTWFTYYQSGYTYGPIDSEGHRTPAWSYLKMTNEHLKTLGPIMRTLKSRGVYFTNPPPVNGLAMLPGEIVDSAASATPLMIGEFDGPANSHYAMIVNLSLEHSTKVLIRGHDSAGDLHYISPVDGSSLSMQDGNLLPLVAGQGALVKFR